MHITTQQALGGAHTVFKTAAAAEAIIATLADDTDGLSYRVVLDPNGSGKAIVNVYDDVGEIIDTL